MWFYILNNVLYAKFVKQTKKFIKTVIIATIFILLILVIKYKPAFSVSYQGNVIGYVDNKDEFQKLVNEKILTSNDEKVAFVSLDNISYFSEFVSRNCVNENSVFDKLKSEAKNYYKVYEVYGSKENDESVYYNSIEEAQNYIDLINSKYSDVDDEFKINTLYVENEVSEDTIKQAKEKLEESLNAKVAEINKQKEIDSKTINGVYIASVPVSNGHITSRFGSRESIRNHTHKGIDIAASYGTNIKAVADGTIEYASYNSGGYGNLVIIDHGNGIKTYYGHCSKLCVSVGQKVNAGDVIAKVGSTGNSTGNHCHFEIRVNGTQIDPQKYVY